MNKKFNFKKGDLIKLRDPFRINYYGYLQFIKKREKVNQLNLQRGRSDWSDIEYDFFSFKQKVIVTFYSDILSELEFEIVGRGIEDEF